MSTLQGESNRITEVKPIESKNILPIKKRLHLRCGNLLFDLEPENKLWVTVELRDSLLVQPKGLIKKIRGKEEGIPRGYVVDIHTIHSDFHSSVT